MKDQDPKVRQLLQQIGISLAFNAPGIGAAWVGKMRDKVYNDPGVKDFQIKGDGLAINVEAVLAETPSRNLFKIANQTLKVALDHGALAIQLGLLTDDGQKVGTKKDWEALGLAEDIVVNTALVKDRIGSAPADAVSMATLGEKLKAEAPKYDGKFETAALFYHIQQWLKEDPGDDNGENGDGSGDGDDQGDQGQQPATGEGNAAEGTMGMKPAERLEMREMIASIGKGTAAAEALEPPPVRSSFEKVIKAGAEAASLTAASRTVRSYSRMSRRENPLDPEIALPGAIGTEASLCVMLDASGSVGEEAVARCAAHVLKVQRAFPGMRCYFITHTSDVCWEGWLKPGGDVSGVTALVHAAASGVSTALIQIAKVFGARVIATASTEKKLALARDLGADVTFLFSEQDFKQQIKKNCPEGIDVILDHSGKITWEENLRVLKSGGRVVLCGATSGFEAITDLRHVFYRQLSLLGSTMGSKRDFPKILDLFKKGVIKPVLGAKFKLSEISLAQEQMENRNQLGKTVLVP